MKFNWKNALQVCLKFLAAITSGIAVFLGLTKLLSGGKYEEGNSEGYNGNGPVIPFDKAGRKIVSTLRAGQAAISNAVGVFNSVMSTTAALNKMFDREVYDMAINQPELYSRIYGNGNGFGQPDPSLYFKSEDNQYPLGRIVKNGECTVLRRSANILEVY